MSCLKKFKSSQNFKKQNVNNNKGINLEWLMCNQKNIPQKSSDYVLNKFSNTRFIQKQHQANFGENLSKG